MDATYDRLPDTHDYDIYRGSQFSNVIRNMINKLEIGTNEWVACFHPMENCDTITITCRDKADRVVPGSPEYGSLVLTRIAHEQYDKKVNNTDVNSELESLEAFLSQVRAAYTKSR